MSSHARSIKHDKFVIERILNYDVAVLYRAWTDREAKARWFNGPHDNRDRAIVRKKIQEAGGIAIFSMRRRFDSQLQPLSVTLDFQWQWLTG